MKLLDLKWYPYRVPFRSPLLTAHGALSQRDGAIVTVTTNTGLQGKGEVAPFPAFGGASLDEALHALPDLSSALRGRDLTDILHFLELQAQEDLLPAALLCGLEIALLDARAQAEGMSVAALLANAAGWNQAGGTPIVPRSSLAVNAVLGGKDTEEVVAKAQAAIAAGFSCLKVKLTEASQTAIERVAAIRSAIGAGPQLRLDANEAWSFAEAQFMLAECASFSIQYVEQPLSARDLAGMARLRRVSPIPLAADEALSNQASAQSILHAGAADILILKPQLLGGLRVTHKIIQEASRWQIPCVITSALETGIGVAAAVHLVAASPEISLACGLGTLDLLAADLLQETLSIQHGSIQVPAGSGLGVDLDQAALKHYALTI